MAQIKPLTEEEKKAKLEDLKAKMLVRKAEQADKEKQAAKANEVCSNTKYASNNSLLEENEIRNQLP